MPLPQQVGPARKAKRTGNTAYDASLAATQAQADVAGEDFTRDVGERLGGLNAIGALRSGGSNQAVQQASSTYATRVGQAAAGNASQFAEYEDKKAARDAAATAGWANLKSADERWKSEFEEGKRRFDTTTGFEQERFGKEFGEDTRRYDQDFGRTTGRDTRADYESDRGFNEDTRRFDVDTEYRGGRATRADYESDRGYGEDVRRFDQGYGRDVFESDRSFTQESGRDAEEKRRYEQERGDAINAEKKKRKASIWGTLGGIGGAIIGNAILPGVGGAVGGKLGGMAGGG